MQRIITDFGSDVPFNKITNKLKEHYGIEVPESSAQKITEGHALQIKKNEDIHGHIPARIGAESLICETDGTMVPIVDVDKGKVLDKRKTRKVRWKECRLTLARKKGETVSVFGGTFGSADETGDQWFNCAIQAGLAHLCAFNPKKSNNFIFFNL